MKKLLIVTTLLIAFMTSNSFAQEKTITRVHELGLTFSSLNSFGLTYKTGSEKSLMRLTTLILNASSDWGKGNNPTSGAGFSFMMGFEKRKGIAKNLDLELGGDFGFGFNYNHVGGDSPSTVWRLSPAVALVFGIGYTIHDKFVLSAEINPALSYGFRHETNKMTNGNEVVTTSNNVYFGLNNIAALTLAYKFGK